MSKLRPELRADKTGKLVTRHVRTENGNAAASSPFPQPKVAVQASRWTLDEAVKEMFPPDWLPQRAKLNIEALLSHSPHIFDRIMDQVQTSHNLKSIWTRAMSHQILSQEHDAREGRNILKRRLAVFPLADELIPITGDHGNNPGLVQQYTRALEQRVSALSFEAKEDSEEMDQALAIIGVVRGVYADRGEKVGLNEDLKFEDINVEAHYIARNIERVLPLAGELVHLSSYDVNMIESLMSTPPALRDGAL